MNLLKSQNFQWLSFLGVCVVLSGCGETDNNVSVPSSTMLSTQTELAINLSGIEYYSISEISGIIENKEVTSRAIVKYFLNRINELDKNGPMINSIIELNPDVLVIADQLDRERKQGKIRGPLHGIPILLKDNIDTGDLMQTTAGSLAMIGIPAPQDAFIVNKLRNAGVIILGKTNLSEWSYFRDSNIPSGWSGRGGQTKNPHILSASPCGSSSGSAAAVAAGFSVIAIGTETNGSIICPAAANGIVGMRPTLGLLSRSGIIPITSAQDTAGPMSRTVRDAALALTVMAGTDIVDKATSNAEQHGIDYTEFLNTEELNQKRIGYPRHYNIQGPSEFEKALAIMSQKGAQLIPIEMPHMDYAFFAIESELSAIDFKQGLNQYLSSRKGLAIKTMADLIKFNKNTPIKLPDGTLAGQYMIEEAEKTTFDPKLYNQKFSAYKLAAQNSIDSIINKNRLDALVDEDFGRIVPIAGYPGITVPSGINQGLPTSIYFYGTRWSDAKLLSIAYAYEQATTARRNPKFLP